MLLDKEGFWLYMSLPIKGTPIIEGSDAIRFEENMKSAKPVSEEEYNKIRKSFDNVDKSLVPEF